MRQGFSYGSSVRVQGNTESYLPYPLLQTRAATNNKYLMTLDELNNSFQEYQDDLAVREQHLKLLVTFRDNHQDDLLSLLKELNESTPVFTDKKQGSQGKDTEKKP